jgi:hypothetical protein
MLLTKTYQISSYIYHMANQMGRVQSREYCNVAVNCYMKTSTAHNHTAFASGKSNLFNWDVNNGCQ